jgi:UPF0176 protein
MEYIVLIFYKYTQIDDPEALRVAQITLSRRLSLRGRVIIGNEGINATLEGETKNIESYIAEMKKDPRFTDVHWKKSKGTGNSFPRLSIKVRPEIVSLNEHTDGLHLDPSKETAAHLSPKELHQWFLEGKKFKIIDMRNSYEYACGRFKESIDPGMENFRDLPKVVEKLRVYQDEILVPVCTAGIRCEKASQYLKEKGFKEVYQLDGGILSYMQEYPGEHFEGSLYTFDERKTITFVPPEKHVIVGKCAVCDRPSEHYENCADDICHVHFICCESCVEKHNGLIYCGKCGNESGKTPKNGNRFTLAGRTYVPISQSE